MAGSVTLGEMRTRVRRRSDQVNSSFISDAEVDQYIQNAADELYDLLVQKFGQDYYTTVTADIPFTGDQLIYPLPEDFYKETGVDIKIDTNNYVTAKPFMFSERNRYNTVLSRGALAYQSVFYKILGDSIQFTTTPGTSAAYRLWYIPLGPQLTTDSSTFSGFNGWEKFVEITASIDVMAKEESDTTQLERQKAALIKRVEDAGENRQAGLGLRVTDVRSLPDSEYGFFGNRF